MSQNTEVLMTSYTKEFALHESACRIERLIQQLVRAKESQRMFADAVISIQTELSRERRRHERISEDREAVGEPREFYSEADDVPEYMFDQRPVGWEH